jgi:hypothetical protein
VGVAYRNLEFDAMASGRGAKGDAGWVTGPGAYIEDVQTFTKRW